jgi:hypothetical protein
VPPESSTLSTMTTKPKPMTPAERQAASRARRAVDGDAVQLQAMVSPAVLTMLRRLSAHTGDTRAALIEKALQAMESETLASMTPAERKAYRAN